ncbi:MAG: hypothetical protein H0U06_05540 [Solirubrobacterales bacterium]|nr:hypothetical protein [Solirubrobacterales bacterium]
MRARHRALLTPPADPAAQHAGADREHERSRELCERAVILAGGRVVGDGPCEHILADERLLSAHDLELPAGFDLRRVRRRSRPGDGPEPLLGAIGRDHGPGFG